VSDWEIAFLNHVELEGVRESLPTFICHLKTFYFQSATQPIHFQLPTAPRIHLTCILILIRLWRYKIMYLLTYLLTYKAVLYHLYSTSFTIKQWWEATSDTQDGVSVGGHMINVVSYADDKAVVSNSQQELQMLMNNINKMTDITCRLTVKYGISSCHLHSTYECEFSFTFYLTLRTINSSNSNGKY